MDKNTVNLIVLNTQEKDYLSTTLRSFKIGENEYKKGKKKEAGALLFGAYTYANQHNVLSLIPPTTLQRIYTYISITQHDRGNFDKAIEFAKKAHPDGYNNTDIGIIYRHKAKKASLEGNTILEQECYKTAFDLFKTAASHNKKAKKHYEHALCNGIGCEYNPSAIADYFLTQLKHNKSQSEHNHILNKISALTKDNMRLQCFMVKAYVKGEYGLSTSHEKALHYCEQFIISLAALPSLDQLPVEYFIIPLSLKKLSFSNEKASILNTFYNFLYADKTNNEKKIEEIYAQIDTKSIRFVHLVLKLIRSTDEIPHTTVTKIKKLTPNCKTIKTLCESQCFPFVLELLQQKLASCSKHSNPKTDALNWIIGLCKYYQKDYTAAHTYFVKCSSHKDDLLTQCLLFETSLYFLLHDQITYETVLHDLSIVEKMKPLLTIATHYQPRPRDEHAKMILSDIFNAFHKTYIKILLAHRDYAHAYQFCYYLTQLKNTHHAAFGEFYIIETVMAQEPEKLRLELIKNAYRTKTHSVIEKLVTHKDHTTFACYTLGNLYVHHSEHNIFTKATDYPPNIETSTNYFKQQSLALLQCSLKHGDLPKEIAEKTQSICGTLAYDLAQSHDSLDYCNQAIAYGNPTALYVKARSLLLLSPSAQINNKEIYNLLERHIRTDDPLRYLSYNFLAEYLLAKPMRTAEDNKKIFDYLSAAINLGNYEYAFFLGEYYLDKKCKEYDENKALHYFNLQIENTNTYITGKAFAARGFIHYERNNIEKALADFKVAINYNIELESQVKISYILGILTMVTSDFNTVNNEALAYFKRAHNALSEYIKAKPNKPIEISTLCSPYMNKQAFEAAYIITSNIIKKQDPTPNAIEWCYIVGQLFQQLTKNKPLDDPYRIHAIALLRYAANNKHQNALLLLQSTDHKEISWEEKINYLQTALTIDIEQQQPGFADQINAKLIALCEDKTHLESKKAHHTNLVFVQLPNNTLNNDLSLTDIPTKYRSLPSLVQINDSDRLMDRLFQKGLRDFAHYKDKNTELQIKTLKQLANKNNHPHASLYLAIHFAKIDRTISEQYFKNSLITGIIQQKNKNGLFKDSVFLSFLYHIIIKELIKEPMITLLKSTLEAKNVNVKEFEKSLLDLHSYNITKHPAWNKKVSTKK